MSIYFARRVTGAGEWQTRERHLTIIPFQRKTYSAKEFTAPCGGDVFVLAGTLDGCIDFAVHPGLTYQLTAGEARALVAALTGALDDVGRNCLYEGDGLLD